MDLNHILCNEKGISRAVPNLFLDAILYYDHLLSAQRNTTEGKINPDKKLLTLFRSVFLCSETLDKRPNQRYNTPNNQLIIQFIVRRKTHEKG